MLIAVFGTVADAVAVTAAPVPGGWVPLSGAFGVTPRVGSSPDAATSGSSDMAVVFDEFGNVLFYAFNGQDWAISSINNPAANVTLLPSIALSDNVSLVAARWDNGQTLVYGTRGGQWISIGGYMAGPPETANDANGLFVFGEGGDGALWFNQLGPPVNCPLGICDAPWSGWRSLGGRLGSDVRALSTPDGLFVFALGTDDAVWYQRLTPAGWSGWLSLGGVAYSLPTATTIGGQTIVSAAGADGAMWLNTFDGSAWSGWSSRGGLLSSPPELVSDGTQVFVFARGLDSAIWAQQWLAGEWSDWTSLGGVSVSWPRATAGSQGTFVFAVGTDLRLYVQTVR
jgi:hypothetical protein